MRQRAHIICAASALAMFMAGAAGAQVSDTKQVDVQVKFIESLSVAGVDDLDFGTATIPSAPATITISPAGTRSSNNGGGLQLLNTSGNTGQAASFSLSSLGGESFSISLSHINPAAGYTLDSFRIAGCSVASDTATTTTLPGSGLQTCTLNVGGTLSVPAAASGIVDVGDLQLSVAYN